MILAHAHTHTHTHNILSFIVIHAVLFFYSSFLVWYLHQNRHQKVSLQQGKPQQLKRDILLPDLSQCYLEQLLETHICGLIAAGMNHLAHRTQAWCVISIPSHKYLQFSCTPHTPCLQTFWALIVVYKCIRFFWRTQHSFFYCDTCSSIFYSSFLVWYFTPVQTPKPFIEAGKASAAKE